MYKIIAIFSLFILFSCTEQKPDTAANEAKSDCATSECAPSGCASAEACSKDEGEVVNHHKNSKAKVTFVELGSVNCIPCKQMQPVMEAIEKKYGDQVNVIFYDVWKEDQKKYSEQYKISIIPTQVFLDENGKEFFRHEGFFPEADIDKILQKKGLTPTDKKG